MFVSEVSTLHLLDFRLTMFVLRINLFPQNSVICSMAYPNWFNIASNKNKIVQYFHAAHKIQCLAVARPLQRLCPRQI